MATRAAKDLTVAKNEHVAVTVAAKLHDLAAGLVPVNALDASAIRLVRTHVTELFELSGLEGADLDAVTEAGAAPASSNGHVPAYAEQG